MKHLCSNTVKMFNSTSPAHLHHTPSPLAVHTLVFTFSTSGLTHLIHLLVSQSESFTIHESSCILPPSCSRCSSLHFRFPLHTTPYPIRIIHLLRVALCTSTPLQPPAPYIALPPRALSDLWLASVTPLSLPCTYTATHQHTFPPQRLYQFSSLSPRDQILKQRQVQFSSFPHTDALVFIIPTPDTHHWVSRQMTLVSSSVSIYPTPHHCIPTSNSFR